MERALNPVLLNFEAHTGLGSTYASALLGTAYPTYAQYRSGRRDLPLYHRRHIEALLLLAPEVLRRLIEEHTHGGQR